LQELILLSLTRHKLCSSDLLDNNHLLRLFREAGEPQSPKGDGIPQGMVLKQRKAVALQLLFIIRIIARLWRFLQEILHYSINPIIVHQFRLLFMPAQLKVDFPTLG
jgi:hypothetical protein